MSDDQVRVLRILGREYNIKAPVGEEQVLQEAAALLQAELAASKKKFPHVTVSELLVLSALNLCARHIDARGDQRGELDAVAERLTALSERIRDHLDS